jgi:hypothetical protein
LGIDRLPFTDTGAYEPGRLAHSQSSLLGRVMRGRELAAAVAALAGLARACADLVGRRVRDSRSDLATLLAQPHDGLPLPPKLAASAVMNLIAAG